MKFIHLTDTHLVGDGGELYGLNPRIRLQQALTHMRQHQPDAEALVITGDLTHLGHPQAYAYLRECLEGFPMPVHLILGNHDSRGSFRERFPEARIDGDGFVQYVNDFGPYRAIFLDTNEPGVHWGAFCERRAKWLRHQLEETDRPVLLFMHHPYFAIGIGTMDDISLRDTGPFMGAIKGHEHLLKHVFFGHIHRPINGSFRGTTFSTLRGTNHQVSLALSASTSADIHGSHEPPQYGVVLLSPDQVTVHLEDYLDESPRFALGAK